MLNIFLPLYILDSILRLTVRLNYRTFGSRRFKPNKFVHGFYVIFEDNIYFFLLNKVIGGFHQFYIEINILYG